MGDQQRRPVRQGPEPSASTDSSTSTATGTGKTPTPPQADPAADPLAMQDGQGNQAAVATATGDQGQAGGTATPPADALATPDAAQAAADPAKAPTTPADPGAPAPAKTPAEEAEEALAKFAGQMGLVYESIFGEAFRSAIRWVTTDFGKFEVHPAQKLPWMPFKVIWLGLPPIRLDHGRMDEDQFAEKEKFQAKLAASRREVLEKAEKGFGTPQEEQAFWKGQDPTVLEALYRDPKFLENPLWDAKPEALVNISQKLDPVRHLDDALRGAFGDQALSVVQAWARSHGGEDRERAMMDKQVATRLQRFNDAQLALALDYLRNGGTLGSAAQDRISRAIAAGDAEAFVGAWREAIEDPALLASYDDDANFLALVRDNLGDASYQHVLTTLRYGAEASKNEDWKLSPQEREQFEAHADDCCKRMKPELNAGVWCKDQPVVDALFAYFANINQVLRNLSKGSAKQVEAAMVKRELARQLLKERWKSYDASGLSLNYRICDGLTDPELSLALAVVDEDDSAKAKIVKAQEAQEKIKASAAGVKAGTDSAPPLGLTEIEKGKLEPHLQACLAVLKEELIEDANATFAKCDDDVVLGAIKDYRYQIRQIVTPANDKDPRHTFACDKRRAEALQLLDLRWPKVDTGGRSLEWRMNYGLQGDSEIEGSELLSEADTTHRAEAEEWYEYTDDFSDAERQRIGNLAREWATRLSDTMDGILDVDDALVADQLRRAREAMESAVMPRSGTYANGKFDKTKVDTGLKKKMDAKVDKAMVQVREAYDKLYGSLVTDIFDHVGDDAKRRECLRKVGHSRDHTQGLHDEALAGALGSEDDKVAYDARLRKFREKIVPLAERLSDKLDDTFVDAADVVKGTEDFEDLKVDFKGLETGSPAFGTGGFLRFLEMAFQPIGGSLRHAIADRVKPEATADTALSNLGIAGGALAIRVKVDEKLPLADQNARRELDAPCKSVFAAVENTALDLEILFARLAAAKKAAGGATDPRKMLCDTYRAVNGIDLALHLRMTRPFPKTLSKCAQALGWADDELKPMQATERQEGVDARSAEIDALAKAKGAVPKEFAFDIEDVDPGFTLTVAIARAKQLHQAARMADDNEMTKLLSGPPEEARVVNAVFVKLYGYDLRFRLKQGTAGVDEAKVAQYERLATTGGYETDFVEELRRDVANEAIEQIYRKAMLATAPERRAVLGAGDLLYQMKKTFDDEEYDRIYRSLTGELTPGDMMRTRDTGSWYTLWIGTDDEGAEKDIKLFFEALKKSLDAEHGLANAKDEASKAALLEKIGARVREKARALIRDKDVMTMLAGEFSAEELRKMEQLLIGGGKQSAKDKVWADLIGLGTGDALMDNLKELSDADRGRLRADPNFMTALYRDLSGDDLAEALAILSAAKDKEFDADLGKATAGMDTDEHAIFETVLKMSPDELQAFAQDRIRVAKVRMHLDDDEEERKLFDELMAGARTLTPEAHGSADLTTRQEAVRDRQREHLVLKHTVALKHGCYEGADYALEAAQMAYGEKGETTVPTDPPPPGTQAATPPPKEILFGNVERTRVWEAVKSVVKERVPIDFQATIQFAVQGTTDPSTFRLRKGFEGSDNERAIKSSIANAPVETVVGRWSNVCRPGVEGTSLADRWVERIRAANVLRDLEKNEAPPDQIAPAKEQALRAENAFARFTLDVGADLEKILAQRGTTVGDDLFFSTGDKDLLTYVGLVRKRVMALTEAEVISGMKQHLAGEEERWTAMGAPSIGAEAKAANEALDQVEGPVFMTDDRKTRSKVRHAESEYDQQRGTWSLANGFTNSDEIVDLEFQRMKGQLGKAAEGEDGQAGSISAEEAGDIEKRLAAFNVALEEYKAAKAAVASALKWAAIILITAVATVLTGPGGPTLLATLLTAAATSATSAAIDELVLGDDFEFVQTGLKNVVKDTAIAGLTFGMAKGWEKFGAASKTLGPLGDKVARFQAWEKSLAEGAGKSWTGFAAFVLESGGKAALTKGAEGLGDAALGSLDLSEWKYGWEQGTSEGAKKFEAALAAMPDEMLDALWQTMLISSGKALKAKLPFIGKPGAGAPVLPGVAVPGGDDDEDPGVLSALGKAFFEKAFGPKAVVGDLYDTAVKKLVGVLDKGAGTFRASKLSEKDIGAFLTAWAKSRVEKGIVAASEKGQEMNNKRKAEEAIEKLAAEMTAALAQVPAEDQGAASAHFKAFLKTGVQDYDRAVAEWQSKWGHVQAQIARQTDALDPDDPARAEKAAAYRRWVLSDPEKTDERTTFGADAYARARKDAQEMIEGQKRHATKYTSTPNLTPEEQLFWDEMAKDPDNFVQVGGGMIGVRDDIDPRGIERSDGAANFRKSAQATKNALLEAHSGPVVGGWKAAEDERVAKVASFKAAMKDPAKQPTFKSLDEENVRKATVAWAEAWGKEYDAANDTAAQTARAKAAVAGAQQSTPGP